MMCSRKCSWNCKLIYLSALLSIFLCINLFSFHFYSVSFIPQAGWSLPKAEVDFPLILGWNMHILRDLAGIETCEPPRGFCSLQCRYSDRKEDEKEADIVVFFARSPSMSLPVNRQARQLYAFWTYESPQNTGQVTSFNPTLSAWNDFFNISMTYRRDSDVWDPYGWLEPISGGDASEWNEQKIMERFNKKTKLALQIVSNCIPSFVSSGRQKVVTELAKFINITGLGKCFGKACSDECYKDELDTHFFYIAFENSICQHYVTEKFWNPLRHLTVPVVLSRRVFQGLDIPSDAFISVDDFTSVKELADHLQRVRQDPQLYLSYFNWTKGYNVRRRPYERICKLCEIAHQMRGREGRGKWRRKMRLDLDEWWFGQSECS